MSGADLFVPGTQHSPYEENFGYKEDDAFGKKRHFFEWRPMRQIMAIFNMSPSELIRLVKLKKAAELIQDGRYRIGEICEMIGMSSPSYFSKLFFKQFDITPKAFEKQYQERRRENA